MDISSWSIVQSMKYNMEKLTKEWRQRHDLFCSPVWSLVIPQAHHPHSFPYKVNNQVSQSSHFILFILIKTRDSQTLLLMHSSSYKLFNILQLGVKKYKIFWSICFVNLILLPSIYLKIILWLFISPLVICLVAPGAAYTLCTFKAKGEASFFGNFLDLLCLGLSKSVTIKQSFVHG